MRRSVLMPAALMLLALSLNAGCGSKVTAPGGMTSQTADDLAIQAATSTTVMSGDVQLAVTTTPPAGPMSARRVASPARAQWDTTMVWSGITYEASRTFFDASDNALPGWDPTAVRVRWTSRAYGTYQGPRDTATVGHDALLDIRGIEGGQDTLTCDGTGRDTLQNTFRSMDGTRLRYFLWTSSQTVSAVRILKSTLGTGAWPISGTATYVVSADRLRSNNRTDVEAHFDATVVVRFDGTPFPEIVVDGTYHYRWNLLTGTVTRV